MFTTVPVVGRSLPDNWRLCSRMCTFSDRPSGSATSPSGGIRRVSNPNGRPGGAAPVPHVTKQHRNRATASPEPGIHTRHATRTLISVPSVVLWGRRERNSAGSSIAFRPFSPCRQPSARSPLFRGSNTTPNQPRSPATSSRSGGYAVTNVRADTPTNDKPVEVAVPDNDWWSWAMMATIFAVSTAAVWLPVILGTAA